MSKDKKRRSQGWFGGNGASDKPVGEEDHSNYSKRTMAADMIAIMDELGFDKFRVDGSKKIQCPLLVVWGVLGPMGKLYDVLSTWQDKAVNVQGLGLECGHYPAQEKPKELLTALEGFL